MNDRNNLPFNHPLLMLVTEPHPHLIDIVKAAVDGGVDIVLWRDKTTVGLEREAILRQLREVIQPPTLLIVNADVDLARDAGADGLHLPEHGISMAEARGRLGGGLVIGRSVHSVETAVDAEAEGADYLVAGTIFASASHPDLTPAGLELLRGVVKAVSIPVIAIGGVTPENAGSCMEAGAAGVAVLSPIMHSNSQRDTASKYRRALDRAAS
jgi:thiamine-phosphate diphosphorylase